ncbi:NAD(P)(+) transhydrogenase (Re/Si-specific) subunit beta [Leptospira biflexa]|jgi:NAD(P) transhydrogenase subunit beta|uniref:NAD(P)(+) transhydrogenase (Re/Si-specific) subunit beta n=1 Tax=Leptospira biflexa TaxID=172 RepID=UPI001082B676|nr:NAD(P)(+) transhydrogenase (Re/Si-specific) subunit beta [Leptospira biflexa]TGM37663.1 NAD(P)(+) transhydrogenase (Re/Si-specific) subunit beta [Leptospira biflexa]TGM40999.1 NAD(P)(+) transhydrogenase (Re/Si-specific) subunit beta [Leptospira biflexa]TGM47204.1 NAD(P)(+) transhydrogenase (Re/Si-specific) subunit beta [Leptospira biflexa]TGM50331.1 NAD(P)(+) transhydrogenase (Re/Si-specific) subunit beta [Leptospira biflexa]TGM55604.1 NAD(P)(+) transhydrogenase (Re/Si-specific) subunit bet
MELISILNLAYLIASILFIVGIKQLAHPKTATRGNFLGALGMLIAVVATLFDREILSYEWIAVGVLIGSVIGIILAIKIQMTAMPQLVAVLNGFGGIASVFVAGAALQLSIPKYQYAVNYQEIVSIVFSAIVGGITFSGSFIAFGKLQGFITEKAVRYPGDQLVKILVGLTAVGLGVYGCLEPTDESIYWILSGVSLFLGIFLVIPIGGADMPVVISLLNSYSGIAASATGFVLNNNVLIIAGSLVGASGIILTQIMCKAMNRSLTNVLFGGFGAVATEMKDDGDFYSGKVKSTSAEEVAMLLDVARSVVIVPGYGMAVAQAQHTVRDLYQLLTARGIDVTFAIHPVAGRMPGHMNVLLAEADIPYDRLKEMDEINSTFENVDVVIVNGANDVTNPLAKTDPKSPIAGMPILDVGNAKTVVVIKRSLSPGFAGVPNPLFIADNCLMLFGDGKKATQEMIAALKES